MKIWLSHTIWISGPLSMQDFLPPAKKGEMVPYHSPIDFNIGMQ